MTAALTVTAFPSNTHLADLRQRLKDGKFQWNVLTESDLWHYHAYDYGFRRVMLNDFSQDYPLDPHGRWFSALLAEAAEDFYRRKLKRPKPLYSSDPVRPADVERDPAKAAIFRRQDAERAPLKRAVQVHGERQENGEPTPEMLAYMRCCAQQGAENLQMYSAHNRKAQAPEARMSQAQINEAMGVAATEQRKPKWEDPEELRRARVELGLEGGSLLHHNPTDDPANC